MSDHLDGGHSESSAASQWGRERKTSGSPSKHQIQSRAGDSVWGTPMLAGDLAGPAAMENATGQCCEMQVHTCIASVELLDETRRSHGLIRPPWP